MPAAPRKACSQPGCPELVSSGNGRCPQHISAAEKKRRGGKARDYQSRGHRITFREAVLARDPFCTLCHRRHSEHADHHPRSKRELIELGLNPDDPSYGRGLCQRCHSSATAQQQPGGWNTPQ